MIETLIAVLIMGLVVTASLKLVALSQRGLYTVRQNETLLDEAGKLHIELMRSPGATFGESGDIAWKIDEKKSTLWIEDMIDIDSLSLEGDKSEDESGKKELHWRELEVTRAGKSIILFMPMQTETGDAASPDILGAAGETQ